MKEVDSKVIKVTKLSKIYPNRKGIQGISFEVQPGEIMGLLGPNGAGKTTTMRLITGYLYPSDGSIEVGGYDTLDNPLAVRRQIGYLPENPPLYQEMTVRGYLEFVARLKGVTKNNFKAEIIRSLELTGLEKVERQLIGSLSKGYKQRVGLAQALLNSPPVLILDEPTTGLDPKQIIEIRNLIKNLAQKHTVILSSHILPEVNMICGRVAIIDQGKLIAIDTPEGLSRQLRSGQRVQIEVKGEKVQIEKLLSSLEPVENIVYRGCGKISNLGSHSFELQSRKETGDIREMLFRTFADAGVPLLEMFSVNLSLEEIFLQLTTHETMESEPEIASENILAETVGKAGVAHE
jgi:ABC-2 type transport system ATP-binding protein